MANLSNINNKFLVTTTGEVLIGGTAAIGAAKLQVTGEARVYTGSNLGYWGVDAGNSYVYLGTNSSGYSLSLQTAGTEKMRIDSSGNVGIGTGADIYGDLHLEGGQQDIVLTNTNADGVAGLTISRIIGQARGYGNNGAVMQSIDFVTNSSTWYKGDIVFKTNNSDGTNPSIAAAERMRIASNGNVGINGASNFGSDNKAIQLINGVYSGAFQIDSIGNVGLAQNAYQDGAWKYYQTNEAAILNLEDGQFKFFNAASGTAGTPITFSERMRIDSSGTTTITNGTNDNTLLLLNGARGRRLRFQEHNTGNGGIAITSQDNDETGTTNSNNRTILLNASSGNVGIGTTSPAEKLQVAGNIRMFSAGYPLIDMGITTSNYFRLIHDNPNDVFKIGKNGAGTLNITGGGNVGIGITSPGGRLEVNAQGGGVGGYTGIKMKYGTSSVQSLYMGQVTAGNGAFIGTAQYVNAGYWQSESTASSVINMDAGGNMAFYTNSGLTANTDFNISERMRITSAGEVLISATSYSDAGNNISLNQGLVKIGSATTVSTVSMYFTNPNGVVGSVITSGSNTQFNTSSDYRLKEDLQDFAGLDMVSKIPVYDFKWKTDESRSYGVMAHELQEVLPDGVSGEKDAEEMQGVDYSKIVPLLVKSIQELKADNDSLKARIETLENN